MRRGEPKRSRGVQGLLREGLNGIASSQTRPRIEFEPVSTGPMPTPRSPSRRWAPAIVGRLEERSDPRIEVGPAPPFERSARSEATSVGSASGRGDHGIVDPDAGGGALEAKDRALARQQTDVLEPEFGGNRGAPGVVEPDRRLGRGHRAVAKQDFGRAVGQHADLAAVEVAGLDVDLGRPLDDGHADVDRRQPLATRSRARSSEQAPAQGQLGVLGPDRGLRLVAAPRVKDELHSLHRDPAAQQVEQRGRGLRVVGRLAGELEDGSDSRVGLDGQVGP